MGAARGPATQGARPYPVDPSLAPRAGNSSACSACAGRRSYARGRRTAPASRCPRARFLAGRGNSTAGAAGR